MVIRTRLFILPDDTRAFEEIKNDSRCAIIKQKESFNTKQNLMLIFLEYGFEEGDEEEEYTETSYNDYE